MQTLGFIGLGVMDEPMCRNLALRSGARVLAFDLRPEPLARLRGDGVQAAESVAALAAAADTLVLSLPGGREVSSVCEKLMPIMAAGKTLVDTSTSPVSLTRALAERFRERGADYADAPVARTRQAARDGTLSIMVGGTEEVFRRIEPLLRCCGTEVTHCGPVGSGQVVKLMNNMVVAQTVVALAEALAVGRRAGVDGTVLFEALAKGSADSFVLRNHGMESLLPGVFPEQSFPTDYMRKDLSYAINLAEEQGVHMRGARNTASLLEASSDAGWGQVYFPALLNVVDDPGDDGPR